MERKVYLYNDSETITAKWDGAEYELSKTPVEIERGVAEHWLARYPEAELRIEDVPADVIAKRIPANPLDDENRGTAFEGLKKTRTPRQKASGE